MSAVETFFQQLIAVKEASQIIVADLQGRVIIACSSSTASQADGEADHDDAPIAADDVMETNAVISGARAITNCEGLGLGVPQFIAVQFHDNMAVQFVDGMCFVTVVGARSNDHCIGGIIAIAQQIRSAPVFRELANTIKAAAM